MFYSDLVHKASCIMYEAHKEESDKGGYPYVFHPFFLATQFDDENSVCVALLHDVIEDHGDRYSFEMLAEQGFNDKIIEALRLLTHLDGVPYKDYIMDIGADELARRVKIADLRHNLDTRRTGGVKTKKYFLYEDALEYLEQIDRI